MSNIALPTYTVIKSVFSRLVEPIIASSDAAVSTATTALTTANSAQTTANTAQTTANSASTIANSAISGLPVIDLNNTLVVSTINGTAQEIGRVKLTIGSTTTAILASANLCFVIPVTTPTIIKAYLDINGVLQTEQSISTHPVTGQFTHATLSHRIGSNATPGEKNIRVWAYVPSGATITVSSMSVWALGHLVNA
jgi:hypothetical protein